LTKELSNARENADKRKEEMKQRILLKVPKLIEQCQEFADELALDKYSEAVVPDASFDFNVSVLVEEVGRNDFTCKKLVEKMKAI
jgi:hypothetical protein